MVQIIAGGKGQGKTKTLINMANEAVDTTDGNIVFIDDDRRHMYDLKHAVRFVDTTTFPLSNYRELVGFICGILSQNSDITEIFIDGVNNVIKNFDNDALIKLVNKMEFLNRENGVKFIFTINSFKQDLPENIQKMVI